MSNHSNVLSKQKKGFLEDSDAYSCQNFINCISNRDEMKSSQAFGTNGEEKQKSQNSKATKKRNYQSVQDLDRVKLVILITEHKNTCFAAARKLDIPYTNAKVIYRTFRVEGRVIQKERFFRPRGKQGGAAKSKQDKNMIQEPSLRSDIANAEQISDIPSLDKDSDSLIREAIAVPQNPSKKSTADAKPSNDSQNAGEDDFEQNQFVAHVIEDVEVDASLVAQARDEISRGIFKSAPQPQQQSNINGIQASLVAHPSTKWENKLLSYSASSSSCNEILSQSDKDPVQDARYSYSSLEESYESKHSFLGSKKFPLRKESMNNLPQQRHNQTDYLFNLFPTVKFNNNARILLPVPDNILKRRDKKHARKQAIRDFDKNTRDQLFKSTFKQKELKQEENNKNATNHEKNKKDENSQSLQKQPHFNQRQCQDLYRQLEQVILRQTKAQNKRRFLSKSSEQTTFYPLPSLIQPIKVVLIE